MAAIALALPVIVPSSSYRQASSLSQISTETFAPVVNSALMSYVSEGISANTKLSVALVAQQEGEAISQRTKAGLQAAKARGVKLGNPNGAKHLLGRGNAEAVSAVKAGADAFAESLRETLDCLSANGVTSARGIASQLNDLGILTARGGKWHQSTVSNLLRRVERNTEAHLRKQQIGS